MSDHVTVLDRLLKIAGTKRFVTFDDVHEALEQGESEGDRVPSAGSGQESLTAVLGELAVAGVEVFPSEEDAAPATRPSYRAPVDPDALYRRDIGRTPLLSQHGEIELARRMRRADDSVVRALSRSLVVARFIRQSLRPILASERSVWKVVDPLSGSPSAADARRARERVRVGLAALEGRIRRLEHQQDLLSRYEKTHGRPDFARRHIVAVARVLMSQALRNLRLSRALWLASLKALERSCERLQQTQPELFVVEGPDPDSGKHRVERHVHFRTHPLERGDPVLLLQRIRERVSRGVKRGRDARLRLLKANLRLVVRLASRWYRQSSTLTRNDLIQEGNIGLMRAVDKFDPDLGYKFSTYASWWIRQAINRAQSEQSRTVRVPGHMQEALTKIRAATAEFSACHHRVPTDDEMVGLTGLASDVIARAALVPLAEHSLDEPLSHHGFEDSDTLGSSIPDDVVRDPETNSVHRQCRATIDTVLDVVLNSSERRVVKSLFGLDDDASSSRPSDTRPLAVRLGLSPSRFQELQLSAIRKLRRPEVAERLAPFRRLPAPNGPLRPAWLD